MEIQPFVGAGQFRFDMTESAVRAAAGVSFRRFNRGSGPAPSDYFQEIGTICTYDNEGLLEAIEFAREESVVFRGQDLFNLAFSEAIEFMRSFDENLVVRIDGATTFLFGFAIWAPLAKEDSLAMIESVMAFRKGYYD